MPVHHLAASARRFLPMLFGLALAACGSNEAAPPPPASPVTVATPVSQEVVDWDDFVGRFEAVQSVEVKPREAKSCLRHSAFSQSALLSRAA